MPNREQSLIRMARARRIVASRLRRNILKHHPGMNPEALEELVTEETNRALAAPATFDGEPDPAEAMEPGDDLSQLRDPLAPRERSPRLPSLM